MTCIPQVWYLPHWGHTTSLWWQCGVWQLSVLFGSSLGFPNQTLIERYPVSNIEIFILHPIGLGSSMVPLCREPLFKLHFYYIMQLADKLMSSHTAFIYFTSSSLNEKITHCFKCYNTWFPLGSTMRKGLGVCSWWRQCVSEHSIEISKDSGHF